MYTLSCKAQFDSANVADMKSNGDNITADVLLKICTALDCTLEDIMETVKDKRRQWNFERLGKTTGLKKSDFALCTTLG